MLFLRLGPAPGFEPPREVRNVALRRALEGPDPVAGGSAVVPGGGGGGSRGFGGQSVANVLWCAADPSRFALPPPFVHSILYDGLEHALITSGDLLWGFQQWQRVCITFIPPSRAAATMGWRLSDPTLARVGKLAEAFAAEFTPQGISNAVWALSTLGCTTDALLDRAAERVAAEAAAFKPLVR